MSIKKIIPNFEKLISQINTLKTQNLCLSEIVILLETLSKILKENQENLKKNNLSVHSLGKNSLANSTVEIENSNSSKIQQSQELSTKIPEIPQETTKNITLFLSSYDFLMWSLQPYFVQNKFEYSPQSLKAGQKNLTKKWTNLLEIFEKIIDGLKGWQQELSYLKLTTLKKSTEKMTNSSHNLNPKLNEKLNQNFTEKLAKTGNSQNCVDLRALITSRIIKIGKGLEQIKSTDKCVFYLSKNLLDAKITKPNWTLESHFETVLGSFKNFCQEKVEIQTNLSREHFDKLLEIGQLKSLFGKMVNQIEIKTMEPSKEVASLAEYSTNWKLEAGNKKTMEGNNGEKKSQIEKQIEKQIENHEIQSPAKLLNNEISGLETEKTEKTEKLNFLASVNLELFLTEKLKLCMESGQHIGILCGQNSTLNDCQMIINKVSQNLQNYLILGESGSLTKIISKINQKESQLVILKNNDFMYVNSFLEKKTPEKSDKKTKMFGEVWFIGRPYLILDSFWQEVDQAILKDIYWQSQINQLAQNYTIGVVRSYWK